MGAPEEPGRVVGDCVLALSGPVPVANDAAREVLRDEGVAVRTLYARVLTRFVRHVLDLLLLSGGFWTGGKPAFSRTCWSISP